MQVLEKPTSEQVQALKEFAQKHGRFWRAELCQWFATGKDADFPFLRQIRNNFGPKWVSKVKLEEL